MVTDQAEGRTSRREARYHENESEFGAQRKVGRRDCRMKWMQPMLATLTREHFSDPLWIYEPKLDGIRCLAYRTGNKVDLYSRNKLSLNDTFSELIPPLLQQKPNSFVVDGEVVAMQGQVSNFATL